MEITFEMIYQARETLHNLILSKWLNQDFLTIKWWGILTFIVISYILVFYLLDKKRFTQILLFGALMTVSITTYDLFGANFGLWGYKVRLFPVIPGVFLYDYTVIPLYYMLVYQYSPNWKMFFVWNAVLAGFIGLVFFPTLVAVDIIRFINWKPIYQAVAPFLFGFINRAVVLGTLRVEKNKLGYAPSEVGDFLSQPVMKPTESTDKDNN